MYSFTYSLAYLLTHLLTHSPGMINFLRSLNSDQAEVRSIVKSIYKKLPTPENISSIKGCVPVMVHGLGNLLSVTY